MSFKFRTIGERDDVMEKLLGFFFSCDFMMRVGWMMFELQPVGKIILYEVCCEESAYCNILVLREQ